MQFPQITLSQAGQMMHMPMLMSMGMMPQMMSMMMPGTMTQDYFSLPNQPPFPGIDSTSIRLIQHQPRQAPHSVLNLPGLQYLHLFNQ